MRSRFFHVFAESSSPSLARFLPREVGLISTLYVFGDAFWLPICKTGSSQLYEHGSTVGSCLKTFQRFGTTISIAIEGWIVNILLYIYIPMHVYYFLMNHMSWMIGPNPFENGCQLRKKEKSHGKDLPHLSPLLNISWEDTNSHEWNLLSQIKRLWMMKGRS